MTSSSKPAAPNCLSVPVELRLLGEHNVMNFLLAAGTAAALGLRGETIATAAQRIQPVEHRLELKERNGRIILDDAFNSNPVGAKNAVSVLMAVEGGKKVLITPGMIELGELQEELNREFGRQIAKAAPDQVLLVGPRQTKPILEGILETNPEQPVLQVKSLFEANHWVDSNTDAGDVILYENDLPDSYNE
jgi:UDP-N-acetylmuramoyl-tripeptide--D-alanyl-D-alanine ligase